jgi:hypothetical protein
VAQDGVISFLGFLPTHIVRDINWVPHFAINAQLANFTHRFFQLVEVTALTTYFLLLHTKRIFYWPPAILEGFSGEIKKRPIILEPPTF